MWLSRQRRRETAQEKSVHAQRSWSGSAGEVALLRLLGGSSHSGHLTPRRPNGRPYCTTVSTWRTRRKPALAHVDGLAAAGRQDWTLQQANRRSPKHNDCTARLLYISVQSLNALSPRRNFPTPPPRSGPQDSALPRRLCCWPQADPTTPLS